MDISSTASSGNGAERQGRKAEREKTKSRPDTLGLPWPLSEPCPARPKGPNSLSGMQDSRISATKPNRAWGAAASGPKPRAAGACGEGSGGEAPPS